MNRRDLFKSAAAAIAGTIIPCAAPKSARAGIWFDEASVMSPNGAANAAKCLKPMRGLRLVNQERNPVYNDDGTLLGYQEVLRFCGDDPTCYVIQTTTPKKMAST